MTIYSSKRLFMISKTHQLNEVLKGYDGHGLPGGSTVLQGHSGQSHQGDTGDPTMQRGADRQKSRPAGSQHRTQQRCCWFGTCPRQR